MLAWKSSKVDEDDDVGGFADDSEVDDVAIEWK